MRGLVSTALLCSVLLSGCERLIQPDQVPPPGSDGGGAPGGHAIRSGRLSVAAGGASGPTGAHAIRAGSLGTGRTAAPPGTGYWIREGRVDP